MTEERRRQRAKTPNSQPSHSSPTPTLHPSGSHEDTPGAHNEADAWAEVGLIVGAFGVQGEIKARPETDFPNHFLRLKTLYLSKQQPLSAAPMPYEVIGARLHKQQKSDFILLRLRGITTATEAERLRGQHLYIPSAELTPLAPDQYYLHELIGLRVRHVNGQPLGVLVDVITTGASDLYVVRRPHADGHGDEDVLLPAVKQFITSISLADGVMVVDPIPGLFDENAESPEDKRDEQP